MSAPSQQPGPFASGKRVRLPRRAAKDERRGGAYQGRNEGSPVSARPLLLVEGGPSTLRRGRSGVFRITPQPRKILKGRAPFTQLYKRPISLQLATLAAMLADKDRRETSQAIPVAASEPKERVRLVTTIGALTLLQRVNTSV